MYTKDQIETSIKSKNYKWFENGDLNLNIIGIRNSSTGKTVTNSFDDLITVTYKEGGIWKTKSWPATTDPGKKAMLEYSNPKGVARLVPGQYSKSHVIGLHQGKYEALKQFNNVKVYRDDDKDQEYDENKTQEGIFGINIHKAGVDSTYVENWSEGCQVFKKATDFDEFMKIIKEAAKIHGNTFTYTLIESKDIK